MSSAAFMDRFTRFAGGITRLFPKKGARILDAVLYPLLGNPFVIDYFQHRNRENLGGIKRFQRFLVISDIHIGDAVLLQTAVSALRDFFPEARIDYLVKKSMKSLLEGNPDVSDLWPAFTGGQFPNNQDIQTVQEMSAEYDAVFNLCPFFPASTFPEPQKVFHFTSHAPVFVRNERKLGIPNHISYQAHRFIYDLLTPNFAIQRARPFEGPGVFIPPDAVREARNFFNSRVPKGTAPVVFLNPDTASPYTRVPVPFQGKLLEGLVGLNCAILLGAGHTDKGIGERILWTLPLWQRNRVTLVPADLSLEAYTALIDRSDVFISGDTGPLHLAAAWKKEKEGRHSFRNRTTVISLFGATPSRLSGYDTRPGYLESEQKAEPHSYQSGSSCRNLTCMHKMAKECDASGCFQTLDVDLVLAQIRSLVGGPRTLSGRPHGA
jgi:ADP-heptose:LPS heptosyltransferase